MTSSGTEWHCLQPAAAQPPRLTLYSALPGLAGLEPGGLRGSRLPPGEGVAMGTATPLCWLSSASLSLRMARRLQGSQGGGQQGGVSTVHGHASVIQARGALCRLMWHYTIFAPAHQWRPG
jgi:hypothetical protein